MKFGLTITIEAESIVDVVADVVSSPVCSGDVIWCDLSGY